MDAGWGGVFGRGGGFGFFLQYVSLIHFLSFAERVFFALIEGSFLPDELIIQFPGISYCMMESESNGEALTCCFV